MKTITNKLKVALVAVGFLAVGTMSAQSTSDVAKGATAVRLIDNKGTIKYLQSNNGITQIVNTTNDKTTTTWQLGGTLTDMTYITAVGETNPGDGDQKEFALDGLELLDGTAVASTNSQDRGAHDDGLGATGFTVLIRDEATGAVKKIQLVDLLQVNAIRHEYTQGADAAADVDIAVAGLPIITLANSGKLFVYRNGVKLRWGTTNTRDFNGDTIEQITINYDANDLPMYQDDIIEIQYIR